MVGAMILNKLSVISVRIESISNAITNQRVCRPVHRLQSDSTGDALRAIREVENSATQAIVQSNKKQKTKERRS
jgi:hypothetical protein